MLPSIRVRRGYYYCAVCQHGVILKDSALDIVDTSFSPGVRRLMARVGGKESFDARSQIAGGSRRTARPEAGLGASA